MSFRASVDTGGTFTDTVIADADGCLPVGKAKLQSGEFVIDIDGGGGGYGDQLERDMARVLDEVMNGCVSREAADTVYGVVFTGEITDESLAVDVGTTVSRRRASTAIRAG